MRGLVLKSAQFKPSFLIKFADYSVGNDGVEIAYHPKRLPRKSLFPYPSGSSLATEDIGTPCFGKVLATGWGTLVGCQHPDWAISGRAVSSTFANFRNSLCYRRLQIIPHLFMHFPKSKIHKELGHCPDAGYPKLAKVEVRGYPEIGNREQPELFQTLPVYQSVRFISLAVSAGSSPLAVIGARIDSNTTKCGHGTRLIQST